MRAKKARTNQQAIFSALPWFKGMIILLKKALSIFSCLEKDFHFAAGTAYKQPKIYNPFSWHISKSEDPLQIPNFTTTKEDKKNEDATKICA